VALGPHFRRVEIVPSLEAACAVCREDSFTLILADGPSLPHGDGNLGATLARLAGGRGRALVLNDHKACDLSGILYGFVEILNKPVAPASLLSKLADMHQAAESTHANLAAAAAA